VQSCAGPALRPFLKWAGGKRQLLATLGAYYPGSFERYVEPFVGSGAVFFDLAGSGRLDGRRVRISDLNADLIGCYLAIRDHTDEVVRELTALEREHKERPEACYYEVRDRRFNPRRAALARTAGAREVLARAYPPDLAAMFIFLNRTGFNGLFRLNRQGAFNVPAGRYHDPRICDAEHLRAVARVLGRPAVHIDYRLFDQALGDAGSGDFVYCDPPYAPLSRTSSFAAYTADGFSGADHDRLFRAVIAACARGAQVVVSNSSAPAIVDLYSSVDARRAGLVVHRVPARRAINSRGGARGPVEEIVATNVRADRLRGVGTRMLRTAAGRRAPAAAGLARV
jgi:DNA adenine methylase